MRDDDSADVLGHLRDYGVSEGSDSVVLGSSVQPGGKPSDDAVYSVFPAPTNRAGIRPAIGSPCLSSSACQKL